ncbi:response regulator [Oscillospiraceae bacterium 50-58]|uniref:response regulator n=1 Tax=Flintibacter muris TaxID=2941327 RepID=UPI00203C257D|nr:response regulator [Flintibacter muris]MCX4337527.1 response regulator [Bacteroidales bacterium]
MKKILIVDDYPEFLEGLSYVLKDHYEVTTAGNLTEAKKQLSTTSFDVICSDYAMPDGTGLDLLEFCRHEKFSTLFILMSATRENHIVAEAKFYGAIFMEKTDSDLISLLRESAN